MSEQSPALSFSINTQQVGPPAAYQDTVWSSSIGGYDAVNAKGKRRAPAASVVREDTLLRNGSRTRLQTGAQDLARNFAIAGWMIRRHLDYVALFDFHARNESYGRYAGATRQQLEQLDLDIERLMREDARKERCDYAGRFRREKMFRLAEIRRTTDGDVGLLKLADGRLQGIEADCIRNPTERDLVNDGFRGNGTPTEWIDGFRVGVGGRSLAAAIHRRGLGGHAYQLQRIVPMRNLIHFGHFTRFASDQTRGVSPVVSAINPLRDVYEGIDYTLAKMKVEQLFALAFYRDSDDSAGEIGDEEGDGDDSNGTGYSVDFGRGPVLLDLDPGDRAEFLSSNNPSANAQQFHQAVIAIALKSLDIPYSFYDESHTNFFGSRAAWLHYERSCVDKRDDQVEMRDDYTRHKMAVWILQGRLTLPGQMTIDDIVWEWVPRGMPWWDPSKELAGDRLAVISGFDNPEAICKRTGKGDVRDNIRATCRVIADARKISEEILGDPDAFKLDFGNGSSGAGVSQGPPPAAENSQATETDDDPEDSDEEEA